MFEHRQQDGPLKVLAYSAQSSPESVQTEGFVGSGRVVDQPSSSDCITQALRWILFVQIARNKPHVE